MRRSLLFVVGLLLVVTSCVTDAGLVVPLQPVELRVGSDGGVEVFVGAQFATPIGDFRAGVAIDVIDTLSSPESWYVVIRRTTKQGKMDKVYELAPKSGLRVESKGRLIEEFSEHRVLIEVPKGQEQTIAVTEVGDGDITTEDGEVAVFPKELLGRWVGNMPGGDRKSGDDGPGRYKTPSRVELDLFGGEIGQPVGEFRYPDWDCSGVVLFTDREEEDPDDDGRKKETELVQLVTRNFGANATCGGFRVKSDSNNDGRGHGRLDLHLTKNGRLQIQTDMVRTTEKNDQDVEREATTSLKRK